MYDQGSGWTDSRQMTSVTGKARFGANAPGNPLKCNICGYNWFSRKDLPPDRCPKCRSTRWNEENVRQNVCKRCGHEWISKGESPKCPKCQSPKWNEATYTCNCKRCENIWRSRSERPARCPRCKTMKWNEEPQKLFCIKCGNIRLRKSNSRGGLCPVCDINIRRDSCIICGAAWSTSRKNKVKQCPSCGSERWGESIKKEVDREWITEKFEGDVEKLSKAIKMDIAESNIILAHYSGESAVSISRRTDMPFSDVMDLIKKARSRLQRLM